MLYIFGDLLRSQSVTIKSQKQFLGFHCFVGLATTDTSYIKKVGDFLLHKKWKLIWWLCFLGLSGQNRHVTESLNPSTNYAILGDLLWSQVNTIKVQAEPRLSLLCWPGYICTRKYKYMKKSHNIYTINLFWIVVSLNSMSSSSLKRSKIESHCNLLLFYFGLWWNETLICVKMWEFVLA